MSLPPATIAAAAAAAWRASFNPNEREQFISHLTKIFNEASNGRLGEQARNIATGVENHAFNNAVNKETYIKLLQQHIQAVSQKIRAASIAEGKPSGETATNRQTYERVLAEAKAQYRTPPILQNLSPAEKEQIAEHTRQVHQLYSRLAPNLQDYLSIATPKDLRSFFLVQFLLHDQLEAQPEHRLGIHQLNYVRDLITSMIHKIAQAKGQGQCATPTSTASTSTSDTVATNPTPVSSGGSVPRATQPTLSGTVMAKLPTSAAITSSQPTVIAANVAPRRTTPQELEEKFKSDKLNINLDKLRVPPPKAKVKKTAQDYAHIIDGIAEKLNQATKKAYEHGDAMPCVELMDGWQMEAHLMGTL